RADRAIAPAAVVRACAHPRAVPDHDRPVGVVRPWGPDDPRREVARQRSLSARGGLPAGTRARAALVPEQRDRSEGGAAAGYGLRPAGDLRGGPGRDRPLVTS